MNTPLKTTEDRVRAIIAAQFGVAPEQVDLSDNLEDSLDADSLDVVELTMALEDDFNIEVPDEDMNKFTTVQAIVDYVTAGAT